MKKLSIIWCIVFTTGTTVWSQVHIDIAAGYSPGSSPVTAGLIVNRERPQDEFEFNMIHVKPQFFGGLRVNVEMKSPFFIEGGLSFTRRTSLYQIKYRIVYELNPNEYMSESEDIIFLPVNIGVGIGSFDVSSGLSVRKSISKIKELSHLKGFHADHNTIKLGWQMGVRYCFMRTMVGLEYHGTLHRVGHGMYVNGTSLEIRNVPGRIVFAAQYRI